MAPPQPRHVESGNIVMGAQGATAAETVGIRQHREGAHGANAAETVGARQHPEDAQGATATPGTTSRASTAQGAPPGSLPLIDRTMLSCCAPDA